ncbi:putative B3 domain-containing protein At1g78640 [Solanum tuberosum]|uniref:Transcription factor n=1 Tax=Solanum tuberosum TaxID=4113 RepID=M1DEG1_SOLTU|nr:PREDICTED: putative B3 domain-containing protein At1g78640 [Solanum tuberosum]
MENSHQFSDDFLPFLEDSVIDAEPISYCLPHQYSSSNTTLSLFPQVSQNLAASKPITTTVDFSSIDGGKDHPNSPFLTLFTRVYVNTTPPPSSTDLCLSLPSLPNTSSTAQSSISSQHCCSFASSSREVNALGNSAPKRSLGEHKFIPRKKTKLTEESNGEGHWITKKLTRSDVNGASRLLLSRQDVNNYILPFMNEEEQSIICQQLCGVDVTVYDMDTQTSHILTLKKWSTNSFHLVKAWTKDFVKRRNLKENDVISICWEKTNSRFCFRVQMRNQVEL